MNDSPFGYRELERAALGFVLEPEMWGMFVHWMNLNHVSERAHDWLASAPTLMEVRELWIAHSLDDLVSEVDSDTDDTDDTALHPVSHARQRA